MTADKIIVGGIEFFGHTGVSSAEREVGQRFIVDVELSIDLARAAQSDNITDTANYAEIYEIIVGIGETRSYRLIEPLAEEIARALLERFSAGEVMVRLKKRPPPINGIVDYAGVEIRRVQADTPGSPDAER